MLHFQKSAHLSKFFLVFRAIFISLSCSPTWLNIQPYYLTKNATASKAGQKRQAPTGNPADAWNE